MTDSEGNSYAAGSAVFYDDGHSVDENNVPVWSHGTVSSFTAMGSVVISPDGGGSNVIVAQPLVHVHKPSNPPDR